MWFRNTREVKTEFHSGIRPPLELLSSGPASFSCVSQACLHDPYLYAGVDQTCLCAQLNQTCLHADVKQTCLCARIHRTHLSVSRQFG